jgi:GDPmannose 4,6-dehydratase
MKRGFITGITGQDGSYLAELLLEQGYQVYGLIRRSSSQIYDRISHVLDRIELIPGDLLDQNSLIEALKISNPDEVYNLASQSFVPTSWSQPVHTGEVNGIGVIRLLDAIRIVNPKIKFYQASSSEMFGNPQTVPQDEGTPFHPVSPYGISKLFAHWAVVSYRKQYGMFACSGISFNHESPRRGLEFVSRKITSHAAMIKMGLGKKLRLGNLEARRDWGYAKDYVRAMWLMLQQEKADDFVIATGESHTVRDLCSIAFSYFGLDYKDFVIIDERLLRPADIHTLVGNSSKVRRKLGWEPKLAFKELIEMMTESDLTELKRKGRNETTLSGTRPYPPASGPSDFQSD